jgi:hypothetical protein
MLDPLPESWILEAERFARFLPSILNLDILNGHSRFLPIIISFEEVEITESYHKFLGLTRSGDNMALS